MRIGKTYLLFILLVIVLVGSGQINDLKIELDHLTIRGTSNLNDFRLIYRNDLDEIHDQKGPNDDFLINNGCYEFYIPVQQIWNSNSQLVKDFREMVLASQFPYIMVSFSSSELDLIVNGNDSLILNATVTMAGHCKRCNFPYTKGGIPGQQQYLMGKSSMMLTDFEIVPPVKLLGLIRVDNEVLINFRINYKS